MKKLLFLFCVSFCLHAQTVKRVTANMNLQTEINNATNGDIFMVEGGFYGDIYVTKQVALIGTGYFLGNGTQATPATSRTGRVHFRTGSAGSMITGFEINGYLNISTSSISATRNNITEAIQIGINDALNYWNATVNNIIIKQNLSKRLEITGSTANGITGVVNGFSCKNNIFSQGFYLQGNISGEIINNTFDSNLTGEECGWNYYTVKDINSNGVKVNIAFKNNILTNQVTATWSCVGSAVYNSQIFLFIPDIYNNNILHFDGGRAPSTTPGNTKISDLSTLYIGYPVNTSGLATDARNQLAANSPAKGAGENGTDCGAFGGDEPYVLSGIPFVPSIYDLKVPQTTSQNGTLNIQIKAKTNN